MTITARDYRTGRPIQVRLAAGRIAAITPAGGPAARLPWVAPGLIDVQVNGFGGSDFDAASMTPPRWAAAAAKLLARGVTTFLPTFCTNSRAGFLAALKRYRRAVADPLLDHVMPGVHVEGPYISDQDGPRGAHNRRYVRDPSLAEIDALDQACGGRLKILTLAPERRGAIPVIRELARRGVVVSIAHTAASPRQLDAAVRAGARFSTHLGNGSHPLIGRHRNYFFDQLADDRLWASVIPDGHHVPEALFRIVLRAKGLERALLASDAVGLAGMPPGLYGDAELLPSGRLQLRANPAILCGSAACLDLGVGNAVRMAGLSLPEAIDLSAAQPARLVGLADRGRLELGAVADLILFDWDPRACRMTVTATFVQGRRVAGKTKAGGKTRR